MSPGDNLVAEIMGGVVFGALPVLVVAVIVVQLVRRRKRKR